MATSPYWGNNAEKPTGIKDPNATLDISFDWTDWLGEMGDTISGHQIIIESPMTVVSHTQIGGVVTIFLSGGVVGGGSGVGADSKPAYPVTCRVTTNSTPPRIDDRTVYIRIQER